jgi:hypothetical protein
LITACRFYVIRLPLPLAHVVDREVREVTELGCDTEVLGSETTNGRTVVRAGNGNSHEQLAYNVSRRPFSCTGL